MRPNGGCGENEHFTKRYRLQFTLEEMALHCHDKLSAGNFFEFKVLKPARVRSPPHCNQRPTSGRDEVVVVEANV